MKKLTTGKMICFAIGQLGWSLLSGIVVNWVVYFYQPAAGAAQQLFIPQGLTVFGVATVIGVITATGRVFDAFTDPWIASLSDRCKSRDGRRIPFLRAAAAPFALATLLVFLAPVNGVSWWNALWIFVTLMLFYLGITAYVTPFNALIPELGKTQKERLNISTFISLTFIVGTAVAYVAPVIWGMLEPSIGRVAAIRVTFAGLCVLAFVCLLVPVFTIREKDYVTAVPDQSGAFRSLVKTFRNDTFRTFVASDISYWIALTMFQTGLPFFITVLLGLPENMTTVLFVAMTALSLVFYVPINLITRRVGKKKMVVAAFALFTLTYLFTALCGGLLPIPSAAQGFVLVVIAALPMAIFGILPQAMVADISQSDSILTGENREGMFYAARTFSFKLGQSLSMLLFTAIATIGTGTGLGYRLVAFTAAGFCLLGGILLLLYNEKKVDGLIHGQKSANNKEETDTQ